MINNILKSICMACLILLTASPAQAEIKQRLGSWDVHYIAYNTLMIPSDIAQKNNIQRSKFNALLNISVLDANSQQAQEVIVSGEVRNLVGTKRTLEFTKVKEGDAIYYLAQVRYRDRERMTFTVDIAGNGEQQRLEFTQEMFVEEE